MSARRLHGKIILICLLAILWVGSSHAAVIITSLSESTPGLAGHRTYTLTATSDVPAQPILGFDFAGELLNNGPTTGLGFFGSLHQRNPLSLPTIYQDFNAIFSPLGWDVKQDSQFLVSSGNVLSNMIVSQEAADILQAAFEFPTAQGLSVPFRPISDS